MKNFHIVLVFAALLLTGCGREVMPELVEIDTLMQSKPDSALVMLQAIDPSDMSSHNEAYYALLITMAQYKCYEPIESDSVIDIAVRYYASNPQGAKLTKSVMYKGAVLAEMGLYREALDCYKQAETLADTTDYLTMGWLNVRMGELYEKSYIKNHEDIARYKSALGYYTKANHDAYTDYVLSKLGALYTKSNRDSALYYINKSIELTKSRNDTTKMAYNLTILSAMHWYYNNFQEVIDHFNKRNSEHLDNPDLMKFVVWSYAKLGKVDSAQIYLQYLDSTSIKEKLSYYGALEDIAISLGDYKSAHGYCEYTNQLTDSIVNKARRDDLYAVDKRFDKQVIQNKALALEQKNRYILTLSSIIMLTLVVIVYLITRSKRQKLAQNELIMLQLQQDSQNSLDNLQQLLESKHNDETKLKELLGNRMAMLRKIMELRYYYGDNANMFITQFNKFIVQNRQSTEICTTAIEIANLLGNNIISRIKAKYDNLTENDLLLLSLISLRFSVAETCVYMNYSSPNVVSVSRNRLARKLHTDLSLEHFVETFSAPTTSN